MAKWQNGKMAKQDNGFRLYICRQLSVWVYVYCAVLILFAAFLPRQIRPGDVMGPSSPGPITFIVDCPTEGHIASLHAASCLDKFYAGVTDGGGQSEKSVACVVHLAPQDIAHSAEYRAWMAKLGGKTQHLMAGHGR